MREQSIGNRINAAAPFIWLNFVADGGRRSRFLWAYENHCEVLEERSADNRYFDRRMVSSLTATSASRLASPLECD